MITLAKFLEVTCSYLVFVFISLLITFGPDIRCRRSVQTSDEVSLLKIEVEQEEEDYEMIDIKGIPRKSMGGTEFTNMLHLATSTTDGTRFTID